MDEDNFKLKVYTILKEQGLLDAKAIKFSIKSDEPHLLKILEKSESLVEEQVPL